MTRPFSLDWQVVGESRRSGQLNLRLQLSQMTQRDMTKAATRYLALINVQKQPPNRTEERRNARICRRSMNFRRRLLH
jgi:hypothetical protein